MRSRLLATLAVLVLTTAGFAVEPPKAAPDSTPTPPKVDLTDHSSVASKDYRVSAGFGFRIAVPALGPNNMAGGNTQLFSFYVGLFGGN